MLKARPGIHRWSGRGGQGQGDQGGDEHDGRGGEECDVVAVDQGGQGVAW